MCSPISAIFYYADVCPDLYITLTYIIADCRGVSVFSDFMALYKCSYYYSVTYL